jgi:putative membrane protein
VESVLAEMRASTGIGPGDRIDCTAVTDEQLEELGEALMSIAHPDPREHALMDRMMGGEGSPVLSAMHRIMGARYLGCYSGGVMGRGVMGSGMTGNGVLGTGMTGGAMMGGAMPYGAGGMGYGMMYPGLGSILVWVIVLVVVVALVYSLVRSARADGRAGDRTAGAEGTPLEILSRRYAKGEITKDQFEEMRRTLEERRST